MIALALIILILVFDLPERLFFVDKTKKKTYKPNILCEKEIKKFISSNSL